jgi:hypothetical protein
VGNETGLIDTHFETKCGNCGEHVALKFSVEAKFGKTSKTRVLWALVKNMEILYMMAA